MELMPSRETLLLLQAATTLPLCGLIWVVQLVHYPLFREVGNDAWRRWHREHTRRISWIVMPLMAAEAIVAALLLEDARRRGAPNHLELVGVFLVALHGASTAFVQVPLHAALSRGFEPELVARLIRTNWVRTLAWSARGMLALAMLG